MADVPDSDFWSRVHKDAEPKGPAGQFERMLRHSSEAEINTWAVRTFGSEGAIVILWLVGEVKRLRADVAELLAKKGR